MSDFDYEAYRRQARQENMSREQRTRALMKAKGWQLSDLKVCPRYLTGQRCIAYNRPQVRCMCELWRDEIGHAVMDHGRIWKTGPRQYVLTWEPYLKVDDPKITEFAEFVREQGYRLRASQESVHNPPATVLLEVVWEPH